MDETTVNMWLTKRKTWSYQCDPLVLPLQPDRGNSRTIIGAIGGDPFKCHTKIFNKTDTQNVICFLKGLIETEKHDLRDVIIVTDNHSAHHSHDC